MTTFLTWQVSGFSALIKAGVGLLQPDVMWMGGPTEFARVVALASAAGVALVPHGCGVYGAASSRPAVDLVRPPLLSAPLCG